MSDNTNKENSGAIVKARTLAPQKTSSNLARRAIQEIERLTAGPLPGPAVSQTWSDGAEALEKAHDWQGLLAYCRRWTQAGPGNYLAWCWLGKAYRRLGLHQELLEACREMLRLNPDDARSWSFLSYAHNRLGRRQEAIEAQRESLH